MEILEKMEYITLNNGVKMPMAGLGTFLLSPACYDFAEAYNAQGGNCTVVDLPKEGITGNDHFRRRCHAPGAVVPAYPQEA